MGLFRLRGGRRRQRSAGQSLVEFALVVPGFLLLLFGLIDFGRIVYIQNAISEGAREGTRWGSVQGRSANTTTRETVRIHTVGIMTAVPSPTVTVSCQNYSVSANTCRINDTLVVSISSRVTVLTPIVGQLLGPVTVSATSKVRVNQ
jgi:Flp pilus assembly protein TadG